MNELADLLLSVFGCCISDRYPRFVSWSRRDEIELWPPKDLVVSGSGSLKIMRWLGISVG